MSVRANEGKRLRAACAIALALCLFTTGGARPAYADPCTGAKLKAIGKAANSIAGCHAKVAATNDLTTLEDCKIKAIGKLADAFTKAGSCAGVLGECQAITDRCEAEIDETFTDAFPSKCESVKRKAAGKLVKAELGCYAKAASKNVAVDNACILKATDKFASALAKAGACAQASTPLTRVENACVAPAVVTDGGNMVTDVCPATVCCDGPTTGLGALTCTGGTTAASCTADGGTPLDGGVCDENGCVASTGDPTGCCEVGDDCTVADATTCASYGGIFSELTVCEESGRCAPRPCDGGVVEDFCGGTCPSGKVCSAVSSSESGLVCLCTTGSVSCGELECGDGCPTGMTCQTGAFCLCAP